MHRRTPSPSGARTRAAAARATPISRGISSSRLGTLDEELLHLVLQHHLAQLQGFCPASWVPGAVCKAWRDTVRRAVETLEQWHEATVEVPEFSTRSWPRRARLMVNGVVSSGTPPLLLPVNFSGEASASAWPRVFGWELAIYNPVAVGAARRRPASSSTAVAAERHASANANDNIGVFLRVPVSSLPETEGASWSRRTELFLTAHAREPPRGQPQQASPTHSGGASERGVAKEKEPAAQSVLSHHRLLLGGEQGLVEIGTDHCVPVASLASAGFLHTDDTLRLSIRVRVTRGTRTCTLAAVAHPLRRDEEQSGGEPGAAGTSRWTRGERGGAGSGGVVVRPPASLNYYCDGCHRSSLAHRWRAMHRCTRGCDFELCEECAAFHGGREAFLTSTSRAGSLLSRSAHDAECASLGGIAALADGGGIGMGIDGSGLAGLESIGEQHLAAAGIGDLVAAAAAAAGAPSAASELIGRAEGGGVDGASWGAEDVEGGDGRVTAHAAAIAAASLLQDAAAAAALLQDAAAEDAAAASTLLQEYENMYYSDDAHPPSPLHHSSAYHSAAGASATGSHAGSPSRSFATKPAFKPAAWAAARARGKGKMHAIARSRGKSGKGKGKGKGSKGKMVHGSGKGKGRESSGSEDDDSAAEDSGDEDYNDDDEA